MQAWRVRYWTSSDRNHPIRVTGMVVAPREALPPAPRHVIAWAHGTWGVASKCALSLGDFFGATPGLTDAIQRGYTVVAPDYPELGSPMAHGYLVGVSTGRSVLDAVGLLAAFRERQRAAILLSGVSPKVGMPPYGPVNWRKAMRPTSVWLALQRRHRRPISCRT